MSYRKNLIIEVKRTDVEGGKAVLVKAKSVAPMTVSEAIDASRDAGIDVNTWHFFEVVSEFDPVEYRYRNEWRCVKRDTP